MRYNRSQWHFGMAIRGPADLERALKMLLGKRVACEPFVVKCKHPAPCDFVQCKEKATHKFQAGGNYISVCQKHFIYTAVLSNDIAGHTQEGEFEDVR